MNELIMFFLGVFLTLLAEGVFGFWRQSKHDKRLEKARAVLNRYGLTPRFYLATVGQDDQELRSALDAYAFTGYIITNDKGEVVGKPIAMTNKREITDSLFFNVSKENKG